MTCSESKKLMMMRKDEITQQEVNNLRRHLAGCRDCAAQMKETIDVFLRIEGLRSFEPVPENAEGLTANILNAVERARQKRGNGASLFRLFSLRALRVAYAVFVLGAVGMFLIQQLTVAANVQSLEERMLQQGRSATGVRVLYTVPSSLIDRLPQSGQVRSYIGDGETEEHDGSFVIDEKSLAKVVDHMETALFRYGSAVVGAEGRKSVESIIRAFQQSVSARVTIRQRSDHE